MSASNLKTKTDLLIKNIFKGIDFKKVNNTQIVKLRKVFVAISLLKMQEQLCTKNKEIYLE